jgi:hypothetical protein
LIVVQHGLRPTAADLPRFITAGAGNAMHAASVNYGADGNILNQIHMADTIVWDHHLADAANLMTAVNWNRNVDLIIEQDAAQPGGVKGMGNMTSPILRQLHTPNVQTNGRLRADRNAVVTSFSPVGAFQQNAATALKIDKLGDAGSSNWEYTHLATSWSLVGAMSFTPHVQSTRTDNQIFFEPGRHFVDTEDNERSRYLIAWFQNRAHWFKFGAPGLNNVTVVIEMGKLTLCAADLQGTTPAQWADHAYSLMQSAFPVAQNIQLPTLANVKASRITTNARGQ